MLAILSIPVVLWTLGALASGFVFQKFFIGDAYKMFWGKAIVEGPHNHIMHAMHEVPELVAWSATGVLLLVMVVVFVGYGAQEIVVADGWLRAGRARIAGDYLGGADALDPAETRRVAGRDADARAYLLLRPYLKRSVRVTISDRRDPTPYWLVSTRDPERLAAAIRVISRGGDAG